MLRGILTSTAPALPGNHSNVKKHVTINHPNDIRWWLLFPRGLQQTRIISSHACRYYPDVSSASGANSLKDAIDSNRCPSTCAPDSVSGVGVARPLFIRPIFHSLSTPAIAQN